MKSFKQLLFMLEQQSEQKQESSYHEKFHSNLKQKYPNEYDIIIKAAARNEIPDTDYENLATMFAIRKAEGGRSGKEFGVLAPGAGMKEGDTPETTLDRQAGWAAATLMKNRERFAKAGGQGDFIEYFGNRWAPIGVANDPTNLNKNWIGNVQKFKKEYLECTGPNCPKPTEIKQVSEVPKTTEQPKVEPRKQETTDSEYTVQSGDTIWKIGGGTPEGVKRIQDLNPGMNTDKIKPGQKIKTR